MSELTTCNYCNLLHYRRVAAGRGMKLTLLKDEEGDKELKDALPDVDSRVVMIHPHDVDVTKLKDPTESEWWYSTMMKVTDHCVC